MCYHYYELYVYELLNRCRFVLGVRCDCGKKFKHQKYKKLHRIMGCGNPPTFYCPYEECGCKFTESVFLGYHLTGFHF